MTAQRPAAVFFDLDGTLIETDHLYADVGGELVRAVGGTWTDANREASIGTSLADFAAQLQAAGLDRDADELIGIVVDHVTTHMRTALPWRSGAQELLASVAASGVAFGLVTMAYRDSAQIVLDSPGVPLFNAIVTGDDVTVGKPDPEPYLTAASQLGVDPRSCVAIEDSILGLTSAGRAGMTRIAVPTEVDVERSLYDARWDTLVGKTAESIFGEWRSTHGTR